MKLRCGTHDTVPDHHLEFVRYMHKGQGEGLSPINATVFKLLWPQSLRMGARPWHPKSE